MNYLERWEQVSKAEPNGKKKFFLIFAYPGPSGFQHVGHYRGYTYADVIARFKRMQGYNVLFPAGVHASGIVAVAPAKKIAEGDEATWNMFREHGVPDEVIKELADPVKLVEFFCQDYQKMWKKMGYLIDFRRFVHTIRQDYKKFIQWQFKKLMQKGYLIQKPYYAPYCPHCGPVAVDPSETDIKKGGNAQILEFTLLKFHLYDNVFLVAGTLRPETIFGQTNVWINPDAEYVKVRVGEEIWVMSKQGAEKLKYQKKGIEVVGNVDPKELIGKFVKAPGIEKMIPILPAYFVDPNVVSGIVTCVPSDAPYDYIALMDLKKNERLLEKFGIKDIVEGIEIIKIIRTRKYGDFAAKKVVEDLGIENQRDPKLEDATQLVYKEGYHTGVMLESCGQFAGLPVKEAKDIIKAKLIEEGKADVFYDFSEEVICRCGEKVVIKRIEDQWFIKYSDYEWTEKSKRHAITMNIHPRQYYENLPKILDWFQDRPCVRMGSWLGTPFPFDERWIIEPISDSTLYPIYYLISKYVNEGKINADQLTESFFDYVFLGKGELDAVARETGIDGELLEKIRKDVLYWYPLDLNIGGKEHQTVHFPVFIMNHVGILQQELWPRGIFVNWWVTGKGGKISKSKGGVQPVPHLIEKYGADALRLFYCHIGSPFSDVVWDEEAVRQYKNHVEKIKRFIDELMRLDRDYRVIDRWLISRFNKRLKEIYSAMDVFDIRKYADLAIFNVYKDIQWYLKRGGGNKETLRDIVEKWVRLMNPIIPFTCEEINGKYFGGFVIDKHLPEVGEIEPVLEKKEEMIQQLLDDVTNVLTLAKGKPRKITIFVAADWKREAYEKAKGWDRKEIVKKIMQNYKDKPGALMFAQTLVKSFPLQEKVLTVDEEMDTLLDAKPLFEEMFEEVEIKQEDPKVKKALRAIPMRPAFVIES